MTDTDPPSASTPRTIFRHRIATRIWHWVNAVTLFIMLGSGLTILNAHPHLYWGAYGANFDHPWLNTIHWPSYVTIPAHYNLAIARRWHLLFAYVLSFGLLGYMVISLLNRHFLRKLRVRARDLAMRFHDPADPQAYNIFQKLSYVGVIFVLIPTMILTGLAMSPFMDAAWPWLLDLFGGRQSARSIHFIAAAALTGFIVIHLTLVILAGPINEVRSMITGRWRVPEEEA